MAKHAREGVIRKLLRERFGDPATAEVERPASSTPEQRAARRKVLNEAMRRKPAHRKIDKV